MKKFFKEIFGSQEEQNNTSSNNNNTRNHQNVVYPHQYRTQYQHNNPSNHQYILPQQPVQNYPTQSRINWPSNAGPQQIAGYIPPQIYR